MRAARFKVSGALLREALHIPASSWFLAASVRDWVEAKLNGDDWVEFIVVDDAIPEAPHLWDTNPTLRHIYNDDGTTEVVWDWNIKT